MSENNEKKQNSLGNIKQVMTLLGSDDVKTAFKKLNEAKSELSDIVEKIKTKQQAYDVEKAEILKAEENKKQEELKQKAEKEELKKSMEPEATKAEENAKAKKGEEAIVEAKTKVEDKVSETETVVKQTEQNVVSKNIENDKNKTYVKTADGQNNRQDNRTFDNRGYDNRSMDQNKGTSNYQPRQDRTFDNRNNADGQRRFDGQQRSYQADGANRYNNQGQGNRPNYVQGQGNRPNYVQGQGNRPNYVQGQGRPNYVQGQGNRPNYVQGQGNRPNYVQGQGNRPNYVQGQGNRPNFNQQGNRGTGARPFDKDAVLDRQNNAKKPTQSRPQFGTEAIPQKPIVRDATKVVKKKQTNDNDNRGMSKRTLMRKGFVVTSDIPFDERMGSKKIRPRKQKGNAPIVFAPQIVIEKAVINSDIVPIKVLSEKIGKTAAEIVKKLFAEDIMKTVNDSIDFDTAEYIAAEFGVTLELKLDKTAEDVLESFHEDEKEDEKNVVSRPPVVTVMGHVDHGKTSLLDAFRHTNVTEGEAGGITQHIGAYTVTLPKGKVTFIDTPGHEAFTSMRKRGAQITDIAVLVVAADDGVMPQTIEAINHIKAAGVTMLVAINKIDKPGADIDRIKQQLAKYEVLSDEWGGDTIMCPVSAKTGVGIEKLLETILFLSEYAQLKANPNRKAKGTIIEAKLDKGMGPVATVLVQSGTLKVGDTVIAGLATGRIRAMLDDKGKNVKEAKPSFAVSVLGFSEVPEAGESIFAVDDEKLSKMVAEERKNKIKQQMTHFAGKVTLEDAFSKVNDGEMKELNLIIKADVQGSSEAVKQALLKLSNEEVKVNVIHSGVGIVTESDVMLAETANAIIIAFNVRPDTKAKVMAEREKVDIKFYRIIYNAIDDVTLALKGMLTPKFKEVAIGTAEVRDTFKITNVGIVAGCYVTTGKVARNAKMRLVREGIVVHDGVISTLKRFKDDAKEVAKGFECGILIENYSDVKVGDIIEAFVMEEIKI